MSGQGKMDDFFEREWRDALENTKQEPPRIVWSEINRELANERAVLFQKKAVYYRWASVAAIFIAGCFGLMHFFNSEADQAEMHLAMTKVTDNSFAEENCASDKISQPTLTATAENGGNDNGGYNTIPTQAGASAFYGASMAASKNNEKELVEGAEEKGHLESMVILDVKSLTMSPLEVDESVALVDHIYRVPSVYSKKTLKKVYDSEQRYWAGVDVGSGTFDPNFQSASGGIENSLSLSPSAQFSGFNTEKLDAESPLVRENMSAGQTKFIGLNFGFKVHPRWLIQSGFQYAQADATNNTNMIVTNSRVLDPIPVTSQLKGVAPVKSAVSNNEVEFEEQDVSLDNQFQFASIPLKAGYLLIDQRLSITVNAGLAANLYLGNKLSDPSNEVANITIGPGSDSPYKDLSFIGLAGLQFGYEFIKRFDIVIEPNYRQSINDLTKGEAKFVASPSGFGLQTGIRYRFN